MFYYNELVPDIGDYVIVKIKEVNENGYTCELIEYNNFIGYVHINDISVEKIRKVQDLKKYLTSTDNIYIFEVKEIYDSNNVINNVIINLNRKYLDNDKVIIMKNKYKLFNKIYNWFKFNKKETDEGTEGTEGTEKEVMNYLKTNKNFFDLDLITEKLKTIESKFNKIFIKKKSHPKTKIINCDTYLYIEELQSCLQKVSDKFLVNFTNLKNGNIFIDSEDEFTLLIKETFDKTFENRELLKIIDFKTFEKSLQNEKIHETQFEQPILNIGIIGHVSHGKTTIIQRLTGIDTKKSKKELQENKTLKLGYTNMYISKCYCDGENNFIYKNKKCIEQNCKSYYISIVDCPGHNILMNTMLTGVAVMDTAILTIACNDTCPQPQTLEHLLATSINSNFTDTIICLNKCDLVKPEIVEQRFSEIAELIVDTPYEIKTEKSSQCKILPISAQKNINLDYLNEWIFNFVEKKVKETESEKVNDKVNVASIVRTFDVNKPGDDMISNFSGLVLGCSILSGSFKVNDNILIMPEKIKTKIYEIYTDNIPLNEARKGGLIGIKTNLSPYLNLDLNGSCLIKECEYNKDLYLETENERVLSFKYYIRKTESVETSGSKISLNIAGKFIEDCLIKDLDTKRKIIKILLPISIYKNFTKVCFMKDKTKMIGYGKILEEEKKFDKTKQKKDKKEKREKNKESNEKVSLSTKPEFNFQKFISKIKIQNQEHEQEHIFDNYVDCKNYCLTKTNDNYVIEFYNENNYIKSNNLKEVVDFIDGCFKLWKARFEFFEKLETIDENNKKNLVKLPKPIIKKCIFTNFHKICSIIDVDTNLLINYISGSLKVSCNENKEYKELVFSKKISEGDIQTVIIKYLKEKKLCENCFNKDTNIITEFNIKLIYCDKCDTKICLN